MNWLSKKVFLKVLEKVLIKVFHFFFGHNEDLDDAGDVICTICKALRAHTGNEEEVKKLEKRVWPL